MGRGRRSPGFAQYGTTPLNYGLEFYSNIGTAYGNVTGDGGSAGPAMIVAVEVAQNGSPVTSTTTCTASSPCSFQVRRYLPTVTNGISSCPLATATTGSCSYPYPSTYLLITNVRDVVNSPSSNQPIFSYSFFDPYWPDTPNTVGTTILLTSSEVQNNQMTGLTSSPYDYPAATQTLTACQATSANYPTAAIACPLDAIQSLGIDLTIAVRGSGTNGTVENQTVVYRYPPVGTTSNLTYPYQWPTGGAG